VTNTEFRIRLFDFLVVLGIYPLLLLNANATNAKKHSGVVFWDTDHFILGVGYMWHWGGWELVVENVTTTARSNSWGTRRSFVMPEDRRRHGGTTRHTSAKLSAWSSRRRHVHLSRPSHLPTGSHVTQTHTRENWSHRRSPVASEFCRRHLNADERRSTAVSTTRIRRHFRATTRSNVRLTAHHQNDARSPGQTPGSAAAELTPLLCSKPSTTSCNLLGVKEQRYFVVNVIIPKTVENK